MTLERERRMWWVVHNDLPCYLEGWRCTPANPDCWYFPAAGFSTHESQVFATGEEARAKALRLAEEKAAEARALLAKLAA